MYCRPAPRLVPTCAMFCNRMFLLLDIFLLHHWFLPSCTLFPQSYQYTSYQLQKGTLLLISARSRASGVTVVVSTGSGIIGGGLTTWGRLHCWTATPVIKSQYRPWRVRNQWPAPNILELSKTSSLVFLWVSRFDESEIEYSDEIS